MSLIIPNIPNRKLDAFAALQAALDESAATGDAVLLSGTYIVNSTLVMRGGAILGQLHARTDDWGNTSFSNRGNSIIYSRAKSDALQLIGEGTIHNLGITCQHATLKADPGTSAIRVSGKRSTLTCSNVILDRANVGLTLEALTCEHDITDLKIRSPRKVGMLIPSPTTVVDSQFMKLYIAGHQYEDYTSNPPPVSPLAVGIDGLPGASAFHGRTLIESCLTAIKCRVVLDQTILDLKIDDSLGVGIELAPPFDSNFLSRELNIDNFHYQSSVAMGKAFVNSLGRKPFVRIGFYKASVFKLGASLDVNAAQPAKATS